MTGKTMPSRLNIARALIVLGFMVGLASLGATFGHIGDPAYTARAAFDGGATHPWHHALREGFGDIAAMVVILLVFFGPAAYRRPPGWWICLVLLLGYYLPYWAGVPFMPELAAPNAAAELNHVAQAALTLTGLALARRDFYNQLDG